MRDIKTTDRNGNVVDAMAVSDDDQVLIVTSKGKIQRLKASDISTIGRITQGVRIMKLDDGDTLSSCAVIASEDIEEAAAKAAELEAAAQAELDAAEKTASASKVESDTSDSNDVDVAQTDESDDADDDNNADAE